MGGWGQEVGVASQAKVKAWGAWAQKGLCHLFILLIQILLFLLFYSLVTGGFQFHHPLFFFSFFCSGRIPKLYIYKIKIFE